MNHSIKAGRVDRWLSWRAIKKIITYTPLIVIRVKNWWELLFQYAGFAEGGKLFRFRNGLEVATREAIDATTVVVVVIEESYGEINEGSTVIDIGANIGLFSLFAAASSPDVVVYAFEPMDDSFTLLKDNVRRNGLEERVITFNQAVGGTRGLRNLYLGKGSPLHSLYDWVPATKGSTSTRTVECVTLQDIFEDNDIKVCDLLKLDCEGAEYEIFYNSPHAILRRIREIRMEYHNLNDDRENVEALTGYLEAYGFRVTGRELATPRTGNINLVRIPDAHFELEEKATTL